MRAALRRAASIVRPVRLTAVTGMVFAFAMPQAVFAPLTDPDVWWVAAAGRDMLATGGVPLTNAYSFTEPARPWLMHEWLFGPPYAWLLDRLGPSALHLVAGTVALISLALLATGTIGRARHASVGLLAALGAFVLFGRRFLSARPPNAALVFPMAITLIAFAPRFRAVSLVAVALLQIAWTNAHGSFPLGVVLLAAAALTEPEDRRLRIAAVPLAALVTLINPYGVELHRFVWQYFRAGDDIHRSIHARIIEFGSIADGYGKMIDWSNFVAYGLMLVLAAGALWWRPFRVRAVLALALLVFGAERARHFELGGLLACILLVPYLDDLFERRGRLAACDVAGVPGARRLCLLALAPPLAAAGLGLAIGHHLRAGQPYAWIYQGPPLVRALDRVPDGARLFAPFARAGFAIWYTARRGVRVFFDSRNDCYSSRTFETGVDLSNGLIDGDRALAPLDESGTDAVLLPREHTLVTTLAKDARWRAENGGGPWIVYLRAPTARPPTW